MTIVSKSGKLHRMIWRPALALVFLAQLVLALSPLIEGRNGPDARAHVEESGTRIHHAHDEAYCSACTVRHLLASSEVLPADAIETHTTAENAVAATVFSYRSATESSTRSRAPPALV